MAKKVQGYVKLQVPAGQANPSPPIGPALGQCLKHPRQHVNAGAGNHPGDEGAQGACGVREGARQGENAGTDHAAHHHGGQSQARHFLIWVFSLW